MHTTHCLERRDAMELDQLRYFLKVAERLNMTRAAEDLGISQPALSRAIQKLEEELGQPVLDRRTRAVALTDAGSLLQSRAQQILSILEDTKAEIVDDAQSGRVRLGAIPTIAPFFLPSVLRDFAKQHPKAALVVQEQTTDRLLKSITQGEIDLAIVALPIQSRYLEVLPLFDEELFLVLPTGHPLRARRGIRLPDVEPFPFILLDEAHCLSDQIMSFCRQKSFQPVAVERTSQLATVQELVSLGHGVSLVPAMARHLDSSKRRTYHSLVGEKPSRTIAAVWNPYRFQSRLTRAFVESLKRSC